MTANEAERALRVLDWLGQTHQGYWDNGMRRDFERTAALLEKIIVKGTRNGSDL